MKKLASIVIALSLFLVSVHATTSQGVDLTPSAKAAILIDYETGQILYEKNSSAKLYPASMTKMMSLLLVVEAIHNGKLSWDTEVKAFPPAVRLPRMLLRWAARRFFWKPARS